jgi:hypothetical protein
MRQQTIEMILLTGVILLSAWIVWFLYTEWKRGAFSLIEGFQTAPAAPPTLQKMMMVLIGPGSGPSAIDGDVFLSQIGTSFTSPNWQKYASMPVSSVSGAEGRLYAANSSTSVFANAPYTNRNDKVWNKTQGGNIKQVSRDGLHVCGVTTEGTLTCKVKNIEFSEAEADQAPWLTKSSDTLWASISSGRIAIVTANAQTVSYSASYTEDTIAWRNIQSNLGNRLMKQVVLDGQRIGALDVEGNIFMADLAEGGGLAADGSLTKDPRWFQLSGRRARYLEMKFGHVLIIDEADGKIYYSNDYRYGDRWENVPLPSTMNEVFKSGTGNQYDKAAAEKECTRLGATLASRAQLDAAWKAGANWCAYAWTTDGGRAFPNNEDTTNWCGGNDPGVKGGDMTGLGDATCFGRKPPQNTVNVAAFNGKFWNAPPLAIEFVSFPSSPTYCGQEGRKGTYKGEPFNYFSRDECNSIQGRLTGELTTDYNAGNGECVVINSLTGAQEASISRNCRTIQDQPIRALVNFWNNGSGGLCIFNPDEYRTKYGVTGDIGVIYEHWLNTGLAAGYSPCGDINPFCRWDPDAYYEMNPDARKEQPLTALEHYKQKGIKRGSPFCKTIGHYSLSDSLKQMLQDKTIMTPPANITSKCTSAVLDSGTLNFQYEEVFLVDTPVASTSAAATCSAAAPGAKVATISQMRDAQLNSANWCTAGWTAADTAATQAILPKPYFVQAVAGSCVSSIAAGVYEQAGTTPATAPVNCFGVKPATPTTNAAVRPFNTNKWSQYSKLAKSYTTRRWTCSTRDAAKLLFDGPSSAEQTYLDKNDTVCFLEDSDQKTYACQSFQEYKNGEDYTVELADSYSLNCDTIKNTLRDLSTTLTAMTNIQASLRNGQTSFQESATNLNSVMTKYNCSSTTKTNEITRLCTTITQVRDKMLGYANSIQRTSTTGAEGVLDTFTGPIQNATNSRDKLLQMKTTLGCPA